MAPVDGNNDTRYKRRPGAGEEKKHLSQFVKLPESSKGYALFDVALTFGGHEKVLIHLRGEVAGRDAVDADGVSSHLERHDASHVMDRCLAHAVCGEMGGREGPGASVGREGGERG